PAKGGRPMFAEIAGNSIAQLLGKPPTTPAPGCGRAHGIVANVGYRSGAGSHFGPQGGPTGTSPGASLSAGQLPSALSTGTQPTPRRAGYSRLEGAATARRLGARIAAWSLAPIGRLDSRRARRPPGSAAIPSGCRSCHVAPVHCFASWGPVVLQKRSK